MCPSVGVAGSIDRAWLLAGNAHFTVAREGGQHVTFRIVKKTFDPKVAGERPTTYFVWVLAGPDNTADYRYVGIVNPATGEVRLTKQSRYTDDALCVRVVRWALRKVWAESALPEGYAIHHAGRCARCGRLLTTPESIKIGIGPECLGKVGVLA